MTTPPEPMTLVERLFAWADTGDMGRKPDPTDLRREAATTLEALAAERDALKGALEGLLAIRCGRTVKAARDALAATLNGVPQP